MTNPETLSEQAGSEEKKNDHLEKLLEQMRTLASVRPLPLVLPTCGTGRARLYANYMIVRRCCNRGLF